MDPYQSNSSASACEDSIEVMMELEKEKLRLLQQKGMLNDKDVDNRAKALKREIEGLKNGETKRSSSFDSSDQASFGGQDVVIDTRRDSGSAISLNSSNDARRVSLKYRSSRTDSNASTRPISLSATASRKSINYDTLTNMATSSNWPQNAVVDGPDSAITCEHDHRASAVGLTGWGWETSSQFSSSGPLPPQSRDRAISIHKKGSVRGLDPSAIQAVGGGSARPVSLRMTKAVPLHQLSAIIARPTYVPVAEPSDYYLERTSVATSASFLHTGLPSENGGSSPSESTRSFYMDAEALQAHMMEKVQQQTAEHDHNDSSDNTVIPFGDEVEFCLIEADWSMFERKKVEGEEELALRSLLPPKNTCTLPAGTPSSVDYIHDFCFPSGVLVDFVSPSKAKILTQSCYDTFHVLQFTDERGRATYACCLTVNIQSSPSSAEVREVLRDLARKRQAANRIKAALRWFVADQKKRRWSEGYAFSPRGGGGGTPTTTCSITPPAPGGGSFRVPSSSSPFRNSLSPMSMSSPMPPPARVRTVSSSIGGGGVSAQTRPDSPSSLSPSMFYRGPRSLSERTSGSQFRSFIRPFTSSSNSSTRDRDSFPPAAAAGGGPGGAPSLYSRSPSLTKRLSGFARMILPSRLSGRSSSMVSDISLQTSPSGEVTPPEDMGVLDSLCSSGGGGGGSSSSVNKRHRFHIKFKNPFKLGKKKKRPSAMESLADSSVSVATSTAAASIDHIDNNGGSNNNRRISARSMSQLSVASSEDGSAAVAPYFQTLSAGGAFGISNQAFSVLGDVNEEEERRSAAVAYNDEDNGEEISSTVRTVRGGTSARVSLVGAVSGGGVVSGGGGGGRQSYKGSGRGAAASGGGGGEEKREEEGDEEEYGDGVRGSSRTMFVGKRGKKGQSKQSRGSRGSSCSSSSYSDAAPDTDDPFSYTTPLNIRQKKRAAVGGGEKGGSEFWDADKISEVRTDKLSGRDQSRGVGGREEGREDEEEDGYCSSPHFGGFDFSKSSSSRSYEDAEVVLSQRAYCIITAQPVHTVVYKVLTAMAEAEGRSEIVTSDDIFSSRRRSRGNNNSTTDHHHFVSKENEEEEQEEHFKKKTDPSPLSTVACDINNSSVSSALPWIDLRCAVLTQLERYLVRLRLVDELKRGGVVGKRRLSLLRRLRDTYMDWAPESPSSTSASSPAVLSLLPSSPSPSPSAKSPGKEDDRQTLVLSSSPKKPSDGTTTAAVSPPAKSSSPDAARSPAVGSVEVPKQQSISTLRKIFGGGESGTPTTPTTTTAATATTPSSSNTTSNTTGSAKKLAAAAAATSITAKLTTGIRNGQSRVMAAKAAAAAAAAKVTSPTTMMRGGVTSSSSSSNPTSPVKKTSAAGEAAAATATDGKSEEVKIPLTLNTEDGKATPTVELQQGAPKHRRRLSRSSGVVISEQGYIPSITIDFRDLPTLEEWSSAILFSTVSSQILFKIINLLLMEKSLIVCGKHPGFVSAVATAAASLLLPFKWEGIFVPLLADNAKELFQAPVPFILGTTSPPRGDDVSPVAAILFVEEIGDVYLSSPGGTLTAQGSAAAASVANAQTQIFTSAAAAADVGDASSPHAAAVLSVITDRDSGRLSSWNDVKRPFAPATTGATTGGAGSVTDTAKLAPSAWFVRLPDIEADIVEPAYLEAMFKRTNRLLVASIVKLRQQEMSVQSQKFLSAESYLKSSSSRFVDAGVSVGDDGQFTAVTPTAALPRSISSPLDSSSVHGDSVGKSPASGVAAAFTRISQAAASAVLLASPSPGSPPGSSAFARPKSLNLVELQDASFSDHRPQQPQQQQRQSSSMKERGRGKDRMKAGVAASALDDTSVGIGPDQIMDGGINSSGSGGNGATGGSSSRPLASSPLRGLLPPATTISYDLRQQVGKDRAKKLSLASDTYEATATETTATPRKIVVTAAAVSNRPTAAAYKTTAAAVSAAVSGPAASSNTGSARRTMAEAAYNTSETGETTSDTASERGGGPPPRTVVKQTSQSTSSVAQTKRSAPSSSSSSVSVSVSGSSSAPSLAQQKSALKNPNKSNLKAAVEGGGTTAATTGAGGAGRSSGSKGVVSPAGAGSSSSSKKPSSSSSSVSAASVPVDLQDIASQLSDLKDDTPALGDIAAQLTGLDALSRALVDVLNRDVHSHSPLPPNPSANTPRNTPPIPSKITPRNTPPIPSKITPRNTPPSASAAAAAGDEGREARTTRRPVSFRMKDPPQNPPAKTPGGGGGVGVGVSSSSSSGSSRKWAPPSQMSSSSSSSSLTNNSNNTGGGGGGRVRAIVAERNAGTSKPPSDILAAVKTSVGLLKTTCTPQSGGPNFASPKRLTISPTHASYSSLNALVPSPTNNSSTAVHVFDVVPIHQMTPRSHTDTTPSSPSAVAVSIARSLPSPVDISTMPALATGGAVSVSGSTAGGGSSFHYHHNRNNSSSSSSSMDNRVMSPNGSMYMIRSPTMKAAFAGSSRIPYPTSAAASTAPSIVSASQYLRPLSVPVGIGGSLPTAATTTSTSRSPFSTSSGTTSGSRDDDEEGGGSDRRASSRIPRLTRADASVITSYAAAQANASEYAKVVAMAHLDLGTTPASSSSTSGGSGSSEPMGDVPVANSVPVSPASSFSGTISVTAEAAVVSNKYASATAATPVDTDDNDSNSDSDEEDSIDTEEARDRFPAPDQPLPQTPQSIYLSVPSNLTLGPEMYIDPETNEVSPLLFTDYAPTRRQGKGATWLDQLIRVAEKPLNRHSTSSSKATIDSDSTAAPLAATDYAYHFHAPSVAKSLPQAVNFSSKVIPPIPPSLPFISGMTVEELTAVRKLLGALKKRNEKFCGDMMEPDAWKRYVRFNAITGDDEFYPQWLLEPMRNQLEFQEAVVRTQLFVAFMDKQRTEYVSREHHRIFISDWLYFRIAMRRKYRTRRGMGW